MILQTRLCVTRQEYSDDEITWHYKRTDENLNKVETRYLDIETVHTWEKPNKSQGLSIVVWKPFRIFHDPNSFIQFRETDKRGPFVPSNREWGEV